VPVFLASPPQDQAAAAVAVVPTKDQEEVEPQAKETEAETLLMTLVLAEAAQAAQGRMGAGETVVLAFSPLSPVQRLITRVVVAETMAPEGLVVAATAA
jgi:hypothetical protein